MRMFNTLIGFQPTFFRCILSSYLVLLSAIGISQTEPLSQCVRGTVTDMYGKFTLPGANVIITNLDNPLGTAADENGKFRFDQVPIGRINIQVSFMGYNPVFLNNLQINTGKELVLNIEMEEKVMTTEVFEVTADSENKTPLNEMTMVSANQFSIEQAQRYAGSMNDIIRMASNYAGTQTTNDTRNDIIVRGNSPMGVLYRLEGIDIPNPNHFSTHGTTGGPISILNYNVLSNSDFMSGAFPAEYGNALAGVFDIKMRNGNNEKYEFTSQIGFNGFEGMAEGPISKKKGSSFLVNYRYSNLELFKKAGIKFGTQSVPTYQDCSFRFKFPYKKGQVSVFGIGGVSYIELLDSDIDTSDNLWGNLGEDIRFGTKVGVVGVSSTFLVNNKLYFKWVNSANAFVSLIERDSLIPPDKMAYRLYANNSNNSRVSSHISANFRMNSRHIFRTGLIYDQLFFNMHDSIWSNRFNAYLVGSDFDGNTSMVRSYAQWKFRISEKMDFTAGAHHMQLNLSGKTAVEPRAGFKWSPDNLNSLSAGFGMHAQLQPVQVYFEREINDDGTYTTPNSQIDFSKSLHYVIGYNRSITELINLKSEFYFQQLYNIPIDINPNAYSMLNQGADFSIGFPDTLENTGKGSNKGVELTLERYLSKGFYFLTTGSIFESQYVGSDDTVRSTAFNGNFNFNILAGKEFVLTTKKEQKKLKKTILFVDGRFTWLGGRPYTPYDLEESRSRNMSIYDQSKMWQERYPDYIRFDLNFGIRFNSEKVSQELFFYFQNLSGRKNVYQYVYNPLTKNIETTYQIGFLPVLQYKVEF